MSVEEILTLAGQYSGVNESSQICYEDATRLYNSRKYREAQERAIRSLKYSIGILHPSLLSGGNQKLPGNERKI